MEFSTTLLVKRSVKHGTYVHQTKLPHPIGTERWNCQIESHSRGSNGISDKLD